MISAHLYLSVSGNRAAIVQAEHKEGAKKLFEDSAYNFRCIFKVVTGSERLHCTTTGWQ